MDCDLDSLNTIFDEWEDWESQLQLLSQNVFEDVGELRKSIH